MGFFKLKNTTSFASVKGFSEPTKKGLKRSVKQFLKGVGIVPFGEHNIYKKTKNNKTKTTKQKQNMKSFLPTFLVS